MKKLLIFCILLIGIAFASFTVGAAELTTTTTAEDTTTTTVATEPITVSTEETVFDTGIVDSIAPTAQLILQILSFVYAIGVTVMAIKGKFKEMAATRAQAKAEGQLSIEQKLREVNMSQLTTVLSVLDIIVQNSKLPTADKLNITQLITQNKSQVDEVVDLAAQLASVDPADLTSVLGDIGDLATLIKNGATAIKTGDFSNLTNAVDETQEGD